MEFFLGFINCDDIDDLDGSRMLSYRACTDSLILEIIFFEFKVLINVTVYFQILQVVLERAAIIYLVIALLMKLK